MVAGVLAGLAGVGKLRFALPQLRAHDETGWVARWRLFASLRCCLFASLVTVASGLLFALQVLLCDG